MSDRAFRFIHAGDFALERPVAGVGEIPEHLRSLLAEAPLQAARAVFEAVLAEQPDWLILSGDLLDLAQGDLESLLFLADEFRRLAERRIPVYWAGGELDPPDAWPAWLTLAENVHAFPRGRLEEFVHSRDGVPLARLIGTSRDTRRPVNLTGFEPDPSGLLTIGIVSGQLDAEALRGTGLHYWALGGRTCRSTLSTGPQTAHYAGSPQGRHPSQPGAHGCTLVQVDLDRQTHTSLIPTDVVRWHSETLPVDAATSREDLQARIRERAQFLAGAQSGRALLVRWTIAGSGPLLAQIRRGQLAAEWLAWLRTEFGHGSPALWSVSLEAEAPAVLPAELYEQPTILGDFLRAIRHYQMNPEAPLELTGDLGERPLSGLLARAVSLSSPEVRSRALREAATLGADLLSGEEARP